MPEPENEITERDIAAYQKSKQVKRTRIELSDEDVVKFAELLANEGSSADFEFKLNLSPRDVEIQKAQLGLNTADDARFFLRALDKKDDSIQREKEYREELQVMQQKLDALEAEKKKKVDKDTVSNAYKPYNMKTMQKTLDRLTGKTIKSDFRVEDENQFLRDSDRGIQYLMNKYRISRNDAIAELQRLSDFELEDENQFRNDARLGINFLIDKYNAKRYEIIMALDRLNINKDLLPK